MTDTKRDLNEALEAACSVYYLSEVVPCNYVKQLEAQLRNTGLGYAEIFINGQKEFVFGSLSDRSNAPAFSLIVCRVVVKDDEIGRVYHSHLCGIHPKSARYFVKNIDEIKRQLIKVMHEEVDNSDKD